MTEEQRQTIRRYYKHNGTKLVNEQQNFFFEFEKIAITGEKIQQAKTLRR